LDANCSILSNEYFYPVEPRLLADQLTSTEKRASKPSESGHFSPFHRNILAELAESVDCNIDEISVN
jgi:hypothetical protein